MVLEDTGLVAVAKEDDWGAGEVEVAAPGDETSFLGSRSAIAFFKLSSFMKLFFSSFRASSVFSGELG